MSLYCGYRKVIQIQRAFHGAHSNHDISLCSYLEGDCTMDTTHLYDWSQCEGKYTCVQTIQGRHGLQGCDNLDLGYLQVHYACIPGTYSHYRWNEQTLTQWRMRFVELRSDD